MAEGGRLSEEDEEERRGKEKSNRARLENHSRRYAMAMRALENIKDNKGVVELLEKAEGEGLSSE